MLFQIDPDRSQFTSHGFTEACLSCKCGCFRTALPYSLMGLARAPAHPQRATSTGMTRKPEGSCPLQGGSSGNRPWELRQELMLPRETQNGQGPGLRSHSMTDGTQAGISSPAGPSCFLLQPRHLAQTCCHPLCFPTLSSPPLWLWLRPGA